MVKSIIKGLIGLCLLVAVAYLVLWVIASLGIAMPAMIINIFWIIIALIAILILYNLFEPYISGYFP